MPNKCILLVVSYQIFTVALVWIGRRFVLLFIWFTETRLRHITHQANNIP